MSASDIAPRNGGGTSAVAPIVFSPVDRLADDRVAGCVREVFVAGFLVVMGPHRSLVSSGARREFTGDASASGVDVELRRC
jgi:hypothetical protein